MLEKCSCTGAAQPKNLAILGIPYCADLGCGPRTRNVCRPQTSRQLGGKQILIRHPRRYVTKSTQRETPNNPTICHHAPVSTPPLCVVALTAPNTTSTLAIFPNTRTFNAATSLSSSQQLPQIWVASRQGSILVPGEVFYPHF